MWTGNQPGEPPLFIFYVHCKSSSNDDEATVEVLIKKKDVWNTVKEMKTREEPSLIAQRILALLKKSLGNNCCVYIYSDCNGHPLQASNGKLCQSSETETSMLELLQAALSQTERMSENDAENDDLTAENDDLTAENDDLTESNDYIETFHRRLPSLPLNKLEEGFLSLSCHRDSRKIIAKVYWSNKRLSCKDLNDDDGFVAVNRSKSTAHVGALPDDKSNEKASEQKYVQSTPEQEDVSDVLVPGAREKEVGVGAIPLERSPSPDHASDSLHCLVTESPDQLSADSFAPCIVDVEGSLGFHPLQVQLECPSQLAEAEHLSRTLFEENDADFPGAKNCDEMGGNGYANLEFKQERKESGTMSLKIDRDCNTEMIYRRVAHEAELDTAEDDQDDDIRRKEETTGDRFSAGQRVVHEASDLGTANENAKSGRIFGSRKRDPCSSESVTVAGQPVHSSQNGEDTTDISPWPDLLLQFKKHATGDEDDLEDDTSATHNMEDPVLEEGLQGILPSPGHLLQNLEQTVGEGGELEEDGIPATEAMQDLATVLDETDIVNLHPQTYKECLANLQLLVLPGDQIPDAQISGLSKVDDPAMTRRPQETSYMHHFYTQARSDLTALREKMRTFFEKNEVDEKALQEYNCSAGKELDKFIKSITCEWRSPFAHHLRDVIAMPAARVQLYRTAGLLKYASMRFHTYIDFPACDRASPVRLAQTGFYYTGTDDLTQCFQCERQHRNWTVMDIPHLIHCYLSPSCPVVMRNEPLSSDRGEQDLLSSMQAESGIAQLVYLQMWRKKLTDSNVAANSTMQTIRNMNRAGGSQGIVGQSLPALLPVAARPLLQTSTPLPQALPLASPAPLPLAVGGARGQETGDALAREGSASGPGQFSRPHANKNFATFEQRLNSFRNWPATRTQRPQVLAQAGFFYAGAGDCVRCYHCGLGLKHWDDDDDPWLEHVRWRSTCEHLIITQGQPYVAQAFQEIVRRDREQEEIVQRFALDEEPRNVPRPRVSDNYQDISSGNRERTSQQTSQSSEPAPRPASQPAPQPTPQPAQQPTPQPAPQPTPQPTPQTTPQTTTPPAAAATPQAMPVAKEQLQGASYNAGQSDDSPPSSREGEDKEEREDQAAGGDDEPTEGNVDELSASERDRIQKLREQNLALRKQNLCRECNKQEICMLFLPCQHLTMCEACARNVKVCKTCKKKIKKKVKTFLS